MSDLISRQAAIDAVDKYIDQFDCLDVNFLDGLKTAKKLMMQMPSAQPEQQWTPCSERLPEVGRSVLLSVGGMYTAEGCLREDGDWTQFRWDAIQRKDMVGAWMPLLEPYAERRTDGSKTE